MDLFSSIIYGIIQGLTEFLPVSSSAHLALLPHFMHIKDPGISFDLAMHVGTALSIILYFRKEVLQLIAATIEWILKRKENQHPYRYYALNMIISTTATVVMVLIIKKAALDYGRFPALIAFNLFIFGLLMVVADYLSKSNSDLEMNNFQWKASLAIGLFQAFAIFPGVSRSGSTLTIARFMHLTREEATRFSFLLAVPIIFAGMGEHLPALIRGEESFDIIACLIGISVSFVTGLLTIHFFLGVVRKLGLAIFAVYRMIFSVVVYYVVVKTN